MKKRYGNGLSGYTVSMSSVLLYESKMKVSMIET